MFIEHLVLNTPEPAAMRTFFRDTLGLSTQLPDAEFLEAQAGATRLVFRKGPPDWEGIYHFAFNIPENRFQDARQWLKARVPLLPGSDGGEVFHFEAWNAHAVYFNDPAGNILEFIARHDLNNASEAPFHSGQILNISEIGLVTGDVPHLVESLQLMAGVAVYRPGTELFAPVGDENGLFIVVKTGRDWFVGTGRPATMVPLEVEFRNSEGVRFRIAAPDYVAALTG